MKAVSRWLRLPLRVKTRSLRRNSDERKERHLNERAITTLKDLLKRPVAYHRVLAEIGGGACAGLMLSQAWYWTPRGAEGWFYKSMEEWEEETGLTRTEQETARRRLSERGLLEEKRAGMPARLYFKVNTEKMLSLIAEKPQTRLQETRKQESTNPTNMIAENLHSTIKDTETTTETNIKPLPTAETRAKGSAPRAKKDSPISHLSPKERNVLETWKATTRRYPLESTWPYILSRLKDNFDPERLRRCGGAYIANNGLGAKHVAGICDWYVENLTGPRKERDGNGKSSGHSNQEPTNIQRHRENTERFVRRRAP